MKNKLFLWVVACALVQSGAFGVAGEREYLGWQDTTSNSNTVQAEPVWEPVAPSGEQVLQARSDARYAQPQAIVPKVQPLPLEQPQASPTEPVLSSQSKARARQELAYVYAAEAPASDVYLKAEPKPDYASDRVRFTPMIGSGDYMGRWSTNVSNDIHTGLGVEFPLSSQFGFEVEGAYSRYRLAYTSMPDGLGYLNPRAIRHDFAQYSLGGNGKLYLSRGVFEPFIGAGLHGVYYQGMAQRMPNEFLRRYDTVIGSGQLLLGAGFHATPGLVLGVRGSFMYPLFNRPITRDNGIVSTAGFEEAALINTAYWKLLGTVSVEL